MTHLPDLVWLCHSALRLQVDHANRVQSPEEMMAAVKAHFESQPLKQSAQVAEIPPGITVGFAQTFEQFVQLGHGLFSPVQFFTANMRRKASPPFALFKVHFPARRKPPRLTGAALSYSVAASR
jgi:hypothetical protein